MSSLFCMDATSARTRCMAASLVGVLAGCSYIAVMSLSEKFVSDPYFKDLESPFWILSLVLFGVIEFKHLANFRRLLSGDEPKFGKGGEKRSE